MELKHIPLEQLHVAAINMRHDRKPPDTSDILPSVRARGILQPLLVRPNADGYEIVAGRRRYFSAKTIKEEGGEVADIPCAIMEPGDDAAALEASLIENLARLVPDEIAQYETFARLAKEGRSLGDIAATFGITERMVKGRLALGNLLPKIKQLYRDDEIDADSIRHLTMATKAQQKDWLALYENHDAPMGNYLKHWLFGGMSISTKLAIFPLDAYKGQTVSDLFEEDNYFADPDLFWELQTGAIEEKASSYRERGWSDVVVLETGHQFNTWEHEKTPKTKGGKVFVAVSYRGEVAFHEGWLSRKEAQKAARADVNKTGEREAKKSTNARPQMTQTMENYLELHRHAVVRLALLGDPATAFRLMVAHAIAPTGNWVVKSDPQRARSNEIGASIAKSAAQSKFEVEREAIQALLGKAMEGDAVAIVAHLLTLTDAQVMRVAVFAMADTLAVGDACVEAAGVCLKSNAGEVWQPDDLFFELIRDRGTVNAMLADVAGKSVAKANADEKAKTQKQVIRDCLAGENGRAKIESWLPGWLQFPFKPYGKGASHIATAAKAAAKALPI